MSSDMGLPITPSILNYLDGAADTFVEEYRRTFGREPKPSLLEVEENLPTCYTETDLYDRELADLRGI